MMKLLDLFSGTGAWSLAFHKHGFETVAFCENDKNARALLYERFADALIFDDIKKLIYRPTNYLGVLTDGFNELHSDIDIITASYPCQSLSVAGKKEGLIDKNGNITRSGLFYEVTRLANEIRPKFLILENVGRQLKQDFDLVLNELHRIGFNAEWHIIRATDVNLPHQRERLFIISYPREFRFHERLGEGRHLQANEERASSDSSSVGPERVFEPGEICQILSRRQFDQFNSANSGIGADVSKVRRVIDGFPSRLDNDGARKEVVDRIKAVERDLERLRKERIKRLGNAIVPTIAEVIAARIKEIL